MNRKAKRMVRLKYIIVICTLTLNVLLVILEIKTNIEEIDVILNIFMCDIY